MRKQFTTGGNTFSMPSFAVFSLSLLFPFGVQNGQKSYDRFATEWRAFYCFQFFARAKRFFFLFTFQIY